MHIYLTNSKAIKHLEMNTLDLLRKTLQDAIGLKEYPRNINKNWKKDIISYIMVDIILAVYSI